MHHSITISKSTNPHEKLPFAVVTIVNHSNGSMKGTKVFSYWHDGKDYLKLAKQYKIQMQRKLA
jgi:hypothetical protein